AGRLGREEGLEQLLPVLRWNANTIVAHPDLDAFAELAGRDHQCRAEISLSLAATLVGGIKAVADEIQEHASEFLRYNVNRCEIAVQVALQCDVEALILSARPVISKIQGLLDHRVQISRLPVVAAAARVVQHAPNDAVGATTVFGDPFEVAGQRPDCLENLG